MEGSVQAAKARYVLDILPAGRNDRVARISDSEGNVLKLIYCQHGLGVTLGEELDQVIRRDWETLDEHEFARKYELPEG